MRVIFCNNVSHIVIQSPQVKNLITWGDQVLAEMNNEENIRDFAGADACLKRHNEIKAEIDTRDDSFETAANTGKMMIKNGHFAATDVRFLCHSKHFCP